LEICLQPKLLPTLKYKNKFKECEYFPELKSYYSMNNNSLSVFSYSGFLIKFDKAYQFYKDKLNEKQMFDSFKNYSKNVKTFYRRVKSNEIWNKDSKQKINELKSKKVYFDFESLNTSIRVVDNTLPFMQTVNQVSIIIDNGSGVDQKTHCNNILFDPQQMNIENYKKIVDSILPNHLNIEQCGQYSYIVFNKNFEVTRLKEME
jgi:hypothetical protein